MMGTDRTYLIDISTLGEINYTGIPKVTLELARHYRHRDDVDFFWYDYIIPKSFMDSLIQSESGIAFSVLAARDLDFEPLLARLHRTPDAVGLFPNVITTPVFKKTVQIICDISYIVVPEFHHPDNIAHHGTTILRDVAKADALICISQATAEDVAAYLQVPDEKIFTIPIGVDNKSFPEIDRGGIEDFILILGTVEPRKNLDIILQYIANNKSVLKKYCFLFCGRDGWLINFDDLVAKYGLTPSLHAGRIVRLPFVMESLKWALLRQARMMIFSSFFEGYGLPVIESLAAGTPVLASWSSSIPEVGGDLVSYFDPTDSESFKASFETALEVDPRQSPEWKTQVDELIRRNTWNFFCDEVLKLCQRI